ncbi:MAG TPA: hypothetical protein VF807_00615 [Ktedonobacterales bacterium]
MAIATEEAQDPKPRRRAITDLYDEASQRLLVIYPSWLYVALGLAGLLAFGITGYLGWCTGVCNPLDRTTFTTEYKLFGDPYSLVLWLWALFLLVQWSIFRDKSLRLQRIVMLTVTFIAIAIVGVAYFYTHELQAYILYLIGHGHLIRAIFSALFSSPWFFTIVNFGLLALFAVNTARRWVRRAQGLHPNPRINLGKYDEGEAPEEIPPFADVISGDLVATGVLALALAALFSEQLTGLVLTPPDHLTVACLVSLPTDCAAGVTLTSLTSINIDIALLFFPIGLVVLALTAFSGGLGAAGGTTVVPPAALTVREGTQGTVAVGQAVSLTVIDTVRNALDRRLRIALLAIVLALRSVGWPLMVLASITGIAVTSEYIETYLHSDRSALASLTILGPAVLVGLISAALSVLAPALYLFRWRVAENSLKFLGIFGFVVLLTFWIFSAALAGSNLLLLKLNIVTTRTPFFPPSLATAGSFLIFLIWGTYALLGRRRAASAAAGQ